jgi:ankyrin repeat protein
VKIVGSGKSTMMSIVVDHLQKCFAAHDIVIAYIYCDWQDALAQTPVNLIGSLLKQLVEHHRSMPEPVAECYAKHKNGREPITLEECINLFRELQGRFQRTFVLADALDEFNSRRDSGSSSSLVLESALKALLGDGDDKSQSLNMFITSRFDQQMPEKAEKFSKLTISAAQTDLRSFITSELTKFNFSSPWTNPALAQHVQQDNALLADIVELCLEHGNNMFLLARLHVIRLKQQINAKQLRKALKELSADLSESVNEAMRRIRNQPYMQQELGLATLMWVANAMRPLRIKELQQALAVEEDDDDYSEDGETPEGLIISSCAGLVVLDTNTGIVRLINFFVKQHLEKSQAFPGAHLKIADTCMSYLSFPVFAVEDKAGLEILEKIVVDFPFLAYASTNWGAHVQLAPQSTCLDRTVTLLMNDARANFLFRVLYLVSWKTLESCPTGITGQHLAGYFGFSEALSSLIELGKPVDSFDSFRRTALYMAAARGHAKSVQVLLHSKASVEGRVPEEHSYYGMQHTCLMWWFPSWARDDRSGSALEAAAEGGYEDVVISLIQAGASADAGGGLHGRPLDAAAFQGHENIVQVLIENGAMVTTSALQASIYSGNIKVLEIFLKSLAHDSEDSKKSKFLALIYHRAYHLATLKSLPFALYGAALAGRTAFVEKLLEHTTDVNHETDGFYRTALQAAASQGNIEIIQLLLGNGADVNDAGDEYIHYGDRAAHQKIFGTRRKDSNFNWRWNSEEPDIDGYIVDPDQKLAYECSPVPEDADNHRRYFDDLEKRHGNALQAAVYANQERTVLFLLDHGANVNLYSGWYGTALQVAAAAGSRNLVQLLLQRGAHVNTITGYYGNPLQAAAAGGHQDIVELLLAAGAKINARGGEYRYSFLAAARSGNVSLVRHFVEAGADVNTRGGRFGSALQASITGVPRKVFQAATADYIDTVLNTSPNLEVVFRISRNADAMSNVARRGVFGNLLQASAGGGFGIQERGFLHEMQDSEKTYMEILSHADNYEVAKYLLERGADPSFCGGYYNTPLEAAIALGRVDIVSLLLQHGADANGSSEPDSSPTVIYSSTKATTPLIVAIRKGNIEAVNMLLKAGADPNMTAKGTYSTETPLHVAAGCKEDRSEIARILIDNGASVDAVDKSSPTYEETPLHAAVSTRSLKTVKLLLEKGADVNFRKRGDWFATILEAAGFQGWHVDPAMISVLLAAGASQESMDRSLRSALDRPPTPEETDRLGNWKTNITLLVKGGADVKAGKLVSTYSNRDATSVHPLCTLTEKGQDDPELVELLSNAGADIPTVGTYPLHNAVRRSKKGMVRALVNCGARPTREMIEKAAANLDTKEADDYYEMINYHRGYSFRWHELYGRSKDDAVEERLFEELCKDRREILELLRQAPELNEEPAMAAEDTPEKG